MLPLVRMGGVGSALVLWSTLVACAQTSVLTQHNDLSRTGQNLTETILTPANVSSGGFQKLFSLAVDGQVNAQPLYQSNVSLTSGATPHNIVFAATEHDSVYAFDADSGGSPLWKASLLDAAHGAGLGATTDPETDSGCNVGGVEYGITGTPVIDPATGTLYVVSLTFENAYAVQRLHALDIRSGAEKFSGPVVISASLPGTGTGSSGGILKFDPKWELQRAGLTLVNGQVYVAFASHCDYGAYHGWLMAYNAATLAQTAVFLTTPNGEGTGLWQSGTAPSVDMVGGTPRMFLATGNGTYDATTPYATNSMDYGDSLLRLDLSNGIKVSDDFTPDDQANRIANDQDLGSGGVLILPDQTGPYTHLALQIGKGNAMFVVNRDNLGGYSATANHVVQEIDDQAGYLWGIPAYWNGYVYLRSAGQSLKQFSFTNGVMSTLPVAVAPQVSTDLGTTPSISANGTQNGIVWQIDWSQPTQVLYAYQATNVANTLWSSATNATRDGGGPSLRYPTPTIANGKVFLGSCNALMVYGLPNFVLSSGASSTSLVQGTTAADTINVTPVGGFTGSVLLSASGLPAGVSVSFAAAAAGNSSIATFAAVATAAPGSYAVTITGTSGTLNHSVVVTLKLLGAPNFSITANPSKVVLPEGSVTTSRITVTDVNGFGGALTFSATGLPIGVTASFSPASSATGSTLTLTSSTGAWVGSFSVNVIGTYSSLSHSFSLPISVTRDFLLTNVMFVNKAAGKCADVAGMSTAVGAVIGIWDCWGGPNQRWTLAALSTGVYRVTTINSGLTLDVSGSSTAAGALPIQDTWAGLKSQQWMFKATADGYLNIVDVGSGMCIDVDGPLVDGSLIDQEVCDGSATQEWSTIPLSAAVTVNMSPSYNVYAIGTNGVASKGGGADSKGDQFPVAEVGTEYSFYGYDFTFGPANVADAVANKTIAFPAGQYNGVYVLAFAVNGAQPNQTFKVSYSDGTSDIFQQGVSDWTASQNYAGEYIVFTSPYRLTATGAEQNQPYSYYGYVLGLDPSKMAVSVTPPGTSNVVVLAVTVSP
jgi:hypothetical protein